MSAAYEFNSKTRLADDRCAVSSRDQRSTGPGAYMIAQDYRGGQGGALQQKAAGIALANPTMTYGVGYGSATAAVIDDESVLRNYQVQTHDSRCAGRVQPRPFLTVPFMGKGSGGPDIESRLQHGELTQGKRECGDVTEGSWPVFAPLNSILAENVQNPKHLIPEVAAPGWIHGGLPSRQYARDADCIRGPK